MKISSALRCSLTRANGTASLLPNAVASASYDAANEQTQFGSATLTYDANGNLTNDGTNTYIWDARNRLIGISGNVSASFVYDTLGRRVSKTINGVTTSFLYDGIDIVQEMNGGAMTATYLRSLSIDEPFIRQTGTGEFYHADALGSTVALSNASGASATTYSYEAFGITTSTGTSANPFQFTGRENDSGRIYYYRVRYYSPMMQRFIGEDPFRVGGGDVNPYAYVRNSPLNFLDPLGLKIIYLNGSTVGNPETVQKLEALDQAVGNKDIFVTSGDRTPSENDRVGGKSRSYHLQGKAADVRVPGLTSDQVAEKAAQVGFDGIITYDKAHKGHTHVDTRGYEFNGHNGAPLKVRPNWRIDGEKKGGRKPKSRK